MNAKYLPLFLFILVSFAVFLPQAALAQNCVGATCVDPAQPVPVPRNSLFGFFGPAGQFTATGLILAIIEIALAIVGLISVLFVIVGGFRYVTSSGNEEQTEGAKKTITHAIIGVVIVVLAFVVIRVITNALIGGPLLT